MSRLRRLWFDGVLVALVIAAIVGIGWAQGKKAAVPPEQLLSADSVFYARFSGIDTQRAAYRQSALHDVLEETSLGKFIAHLTQVLSQAFGAEEGVGAARDLLEDVWHHGAVAGLSFSAAPKIEPALTVVLPGGATADRLAKLEKSLQAMANPELQKVERDGRTVYLLGKGSDQLA
ncbi:MAG: hypothetical protein HY000_17365, partial [Planctomycetes bacterium]|nr:hypothetical protein [Planctomycetota bacterium]